MKRFAMNLKVLGALHRPQAGGPDHRHENSGFELRRIFLAEPRTSLHLLPE